VSQTKSSRKLVATCATIACAAAVAAASIVSDTALAQDAQAASSTQAAPAAQAEQPASHPSRASLRHANHKLEREVRIALTHAKIDTTDILIRAKGSKVALIGAVPDQNMIQSASDIAGKVTGVTAVQNLLILRPESDD
jgi:osmotically-inducible protein OsmY